MTVLQGNGATATATTLTTTIMTTTACCTYYFCAGSYHTLGHGAADGRKGTTIYVCDYYRGSEVVVLRTFDELQLHAPLFFRYILLLR